MQSTRRWIRSGLGSDGDRLLQTVNDIRGPLSALEFTSDLAVPPLTEILMQRLVDIFTKNVNGAFGQTKQSPVPVRAVRSRSEIKIEKKRIPSAKKGTAPEADSTAVERFTKFAYSLPAAPNTAVARD